MLPFYWLTTDETFSPVIMNLHGSTLLDVKSECETCAEPQRNHIQIQLEKITKLNTDKECKIVYL